MKSKYLFKFRIGESLLKKHVYWIECENRANVTAALLCYDQINRPGTCDSSFDHNTYQLFHVRVRRRFILSTISSDVCLNEQKNRTNTSKFIYYAIFVSISRLPFNWRAPIGYLIALLIESIDTVCSDFSGLPVACFLFQTCQLFQAFVEDISNDVSLLDLEFCSSEAKGPEMIQKFNSIIHNFAIVKQLSEMKRRKHFFSIFVWTFTYFRFVGKFNECYEYIITDISFWANLMICTTLLTIQFEIVEFISFLLTIFI